MKSVSCPLSPCPTGLGGDHPLMSLGQGHREVCLGPALPSHCLLGLTIGVTGQGFQIQIPGPCEQVRCSLAIPGLSYWHINRVNSFIFHLF